MRTSQRFRAQGRGLPLKVVDVEMTPDGRRVTVLFASETRIDSASRCEISRGSSGPESRCGRWEPAT